MIVNRKNRTRKIIGNLIVAYIVFPLLYLNNFFFNRTKLFVPNR